MGDYKYSCLLKINGEKGERYEYHDVDIKSFHKDIVPKIAQSSTYEIIGIKNPRTRVEMRDEKPIIIVD